MALQIPELSPEVALSIAMAGGAVPYLCRVAFTGPLFFLSASAQALHEPAPVNPSLMEEAMARARCAEIGASVRDLGAEEALTAVALYLAARGVVEPLQHLAVLCLQYGLPDTAFTIATAIAEHTTAGNWFR